MAAFVVPGAAQAQAVCHTRSCNHRVALKHARWNAHWCARHRACAARVTKRRIVAPYRAWLARVRACESHGNYATNTGNGFYGAYQFTPRTWWAAGGRGLPHQASPLEQDYRAVLWRKRIGNPHTPAGWPVCG